MATGKKMNAIRWRWAGFWDVETRCRCAILAALFFASLLPLSSRTLRAADRTFVGVLALAVEDDVAKELGLSDDVKQKLQDLIDRRETDVVDLSLTLKGLSPAEQAEKLAPFVAESEKLGLALLSATQRTKLAQLRIARDGMTTVAEPKVAEKIGLSEKQREDIEQLVKQHDAAVASGGEQARRLARAKFERELTAVLTKEQRAAWERLAGLAGADAAPADDDDDKPVSKTPAEKDESDKPAADKPAADKPESAEPAAKKPASPAKNGPRKTTTKTKSGDKDAAAKKPNGDGLIEFKFRFAPYKDVLAWFADQANLSLDSSVMPPGTFNLSDGRRYTPVQAIDILNSSLLVKGFTLIRREGMLFVWNLEDDIPDPLVELVTPEALNERGKYELVKCIFPLKKMTPEDAEKEIMKLMGPMGKVIVLTQARQIMVRETGAKLRAIRDILEAVENPDLRKDEKLQVIQLEHLTPEEFLTTARSVLGLPEGGNSAPDGSLRIAVDTPNARLLATGKAERVQRVEEIRKLLDTATKQANITELPEEPQLEIYSVGAADPNAVLQVLQTLLGGDTAVRLTTDPKTGNLVALAKPSQHGTIRETLKQMQKDASDVKVITLRRVDPQTAVVAINKLFGGDEKGGGGNAPKIESDPTARQLFVRGTTTQVQQIQSLLEQMGESDAALSADETDRGNVRLLPLSGRAARTALEQAEMLWPTVGKNRIIVKTHSSTNTGIQSRTHRPADNLPETSPPETKPQETKPPEAKSRQKSPAPAEPAAVPARRDASARKVARFEFVAFGEDESPADEKPAKKKPARAPASDTTSDMADIIVTVGPGGIVIASEDTEALDRFEALLKMLADRTRTSSKDPTVFFLKFAKAESAAALLQEVLSGGGGGDSGGGGGGSLLGDLASGMLGDMGGGLLGGLLGGGGGGGGVTKSLTGGSISIIPDGRLNALFIQASSGDLDLIEQLLQVIDQEGGPEEVQTQGRPRFIHVVNMPAEEVASVVRQAFPDRLIADASQQQQRQPSPEDFVRMLRGGGGRGGRDSKAEAKREPAKMSIGVHTQSNSLIVTAPEPLFQEVKALVEHVDQAAATSRGDETTTIVTVKRGNASAVQKALSAMTGGNVKVNTNSAQSGTTPGAAGGRGGDTQAVPFPGSPEQIQQIQQRIDSFNRGGGGRGGRPGG